jgi:hypothetical protein
MSAPAIDGPRESLASRGWAFFKSYALTVGTVLLEFATPLALFLAFNAAAESQLRDNERIGLAWMRYASIADQRERETKYPAYAPSSDVQRSRMKQAAVADAMAAA